VLPFYQNYSNLTKDGDMTTFSCYTTSAQSSWGWGEPLKSPKINFSLRSIVKLKKKKFYFSLSGNYNFSFGTDCRWVTQYGHRTLNEDADHLQMLQGPGHAWKIKKNIYIISYPHGWLSRLPLLSTTDTMRRVKTYANFVTWALPDIILSSKSLVPFWRFIH
jgi:hypothetical protein